MPERRPRITSELAARLDKLRSPEETFEGFINYILDEYADRRENVAGGGPASTANRIYDFEDVGGAFCYLDRLNGGWGKDKYNDVIGGLVVDGTEQGYDSVGAYLTRDSARAMRDAFTELLGEIPRPANGAKAENKP